MWGGITAAAALTLWAFIGLESATVPAEEVHDPEKTILRATVIGTLVTTLVYVVATVAIIGVIPLGRLAGSTPVRRRRPRDVRRSMGEARCAVALISVFGGLNGWIRSRGVSRWPPREMGCSPSGSDSSTGGAGRQCSAWSSPRCWSGLILVYSSKGLVVPVTFILLATLTTLVPYAFAAASHLDLMIREPDRFAGRRLISDSIIARWASGTRSWRWRMARDVSHGVPAVDGRYPRSSDGLAPPLGAERARGA